VSPGYRLEKTAGAEAAEKTATSAEAALDERRGGWVERLLEGVRRSFPACRCTWVWRMATST